ncbi:molecular chaperone HtpG [Desulfovibrio sp. OttesenSCG-928-A18]|nr:molecular chaperone HtpG [Desulfovibrio sp. OttesenSCG-928-A18]
MAKAKKHSFKAETQKVLSILTHSLYTNREIFLRELLSNASDALDKLRFLQSRGETIRDAGLPLEIRIHADKEKNILEISDSGLGMTEKELVENLGTIAKSGSEQFIRDMTASGDAPADAAGENAAGATAANAAADPENNGPRDQETAETPPSTADIIGRFGIGFYSVFMVAEAVDVISLPALGNEGAHTWSSSGAGSFSVKELDETTEGDENAMPRRGTRIRIRLKEDAKEFLEKYRLEAVIRKHSNFLSFPIYLDDERVNTTPALWREPKFSISPQQYTDFYSYLTYDDKPPLDYIHLSVDAPVQFNALIFIPDSPQDFFGERQGDWGLDLYVRRVLIERSNSELVPQYLAFLKGVVDTEDLPLNISRETLQENILLRKISQTIVKQLLKHLEKMAESDSGKYEAFWRLHGKYFKFAFNDYLQRDHVAPLMRFSSSASDKGELISLDQYLGRARAGQKEIWHVAAPTPEAARVNPYMERFRRKGIEVLYLLEPVDEFALESLGKYKDHPFKSVERAEAADLEAFPDLDEAAPTAQGLSPEEKASLEPLLERMRAILGDRVKEIRVSDRISGSPAVLVSPEGVSSSMEKLIRVMQKDESIPQKILEINPEHPLFRSLLRILAAKADTDLIPDFINSLFDNVQLLDGYLGDPHLMADRNLKLISKAASWYAELPSS